MPVEHSVARHYGLGDLMQRIEAGLAAQGSDLAALSTEDLAPVDEFHSGGRTATDAFARRLAPEAGARLLDVGCGLGGASRFFATAWSCHVTGIDLTPEYIDVAKELARRTGLEGLVDYHAGSALELPFGDSAFDGAYTLHVAMNIEAKDRLYAEVFRVLRAGGVFGIYDLMKGAGGELHYPVPWAASPATSFVVTPDEVERLVTEAGFEVVSRLDLTDFARAHFEQQAARFARTGPPPFGTALLMGDDAKQKIANMRHNVEERRIAPTELILRRP